MNNAIVSYKGYDAEIHFDANEGILYGKLEGITDSISFHSDRISDIEEEFHMAVDDYLDFCERVGKEPERPFKGSFNVRVKPDLHRKLFLRANEDGVKLNTVVERAFEEYLNGSDKANSLTINFMWGKERDTQYVTSFMKSPSYGEMNLIQGGVN